VQVNTSNSFPYNILVAQQDNSTQRIPHRVNRGGISVMAGMYAC